jgi:hypothetical protein
LFGWGECGANSTRHFMGDGVEGGGLSQGGKPDSVSLGEVTKLPSAA